MKKQRQNQCPPRQRAAEAIFRWLAGGLLLASALGCAPPGEAPFEQLLRSVVVYSDVEREIAEPILSACGDTERLTVETVFGDEPLSNDDLEFDVLWTEVPVPLHSLSRSSLRPYAPAEDFNLSRTLRDLNGSWTGLAARAQVLLVNTDLVPDAERPTSILDLGAPQWSGQTAIASPLEGPTALHVAALFTAWGQGRTEAFLDDLKTNGVQIADSNQAVAQLVADGEIAFGLTDTDHAHRALEAGHPVAVIYPDQVKSERGAPGAFVIPTSISLIRGRPNPSADQLAACLLSPESQRKLAKNAARIPLRWGVETPPHVKPLESLSIIEFDFTDDAKAVEKNLPWLRHWAG
ncbi:MAG: extracellular solute-binding protein [Acidobacteriota bacterium]